MSNRALPEATLKEIVKQLFKYKKDNKLRMVEVADRIGVKDSTMYNWKNGTGYPTIRSIIGMQKAGVIDVSIPEAIRNKAVMNEIVRQDDKNKVPRAYNKRVSVPDVLRNQIKLMLDNYVDMLAQPKTFSEFREEQSVFIDKLVYTCKQGS